MSVVNQALYLYTYISPGKADCPYFSKVELLADQLANTLSSFNVHKIVKTPDEWEVC